MLDPAVLARLNKPDIVEYYSRNPHRIGALRSILDLLDIPIPPWAERGISGRAAANRDMIAAYRRDNPESLHAATVRKVAGGR